MVRSANAARCGLVNENDLAEALNQGKIAGAGLDVCGVFLRYGTYDQT